MAFKGPIVSHRTIRSIALGKGTVPSGFEGQMESPDLTVPPYRDIAEGAQPPPSSGVREADPQPKPFKVG